MLSKENRTLFPFISLSSLVFKTCSKPFSVAKTSSFYGSDATFRVFIPEKQTSMQACGEMSSEEGLPGRCSTGASKIRSPDPLLPPLPSSVWLLHKLLLSL